MFKTDDVTVILAGAGCGKTTEIEMRVEALLEKYLPGEIALVSFTQKGAAEGRDRILRSTGLQAKDFPYMGTLHKLTFAALGYTSEVIFGRKDIKRFNELLGYKVSLMDQDGVGTSDDQIIALYDKIRAGIEFDELEEATDNFDYSKLVSAYQKYKQTFKKIDFTDCLENFVERGEPFPVRVAIMDEAQDFNTLMWNACFTGFSGAEKIIIAGDDYQSIYKYSGARPDILINLANTSKLVKLEKSYRLPKKVYELAKGITDQITEKVDKDYAPVKTTQGKVEWVSDRDYMVRKIADTQDETWLVLFRNNHYIPEVADELKKRLVIFHNSKHFVIPEDILARIKKYYAFRKRGYSTDEARHRFAEMYNIKDFSADFTESCLVMGDDAYLYQAYIDKYGIEKLVTAAKSKPRVLLSTIHRVKGAEARNVAVYLDCSRRTKHMQQDDLDSELRLMYVAVTRTITNLYLVRSQSKYGLDDIIELVQDEIS